MEERIRIRWIDKSFRISCKGSSENPLHFIFRYKGDSVGQYSRYPFDQNFPSFLRLLLYCIIRPQSRHIQCSIRMNPIICFGIWQVTSADLHSGQILLILINNRLLSNPLTNLFNHYIRILWGGRPKPLYILFSHTKGLLWGTANTSVRIGPLHHYCQKLTAI